MNCFCWLVSLHSSFFHVNHYQNAYEWSSKILSLEKRNTFDGNGFILFCTISTANIPVHHLLFLLQHHSCREKRIQSEPNLGEFSGLKYLIGFRAIYSCDSLCYRYECPFTFQESDHIENESLYYILFSCCLENLKLNVTPGSSMLLKVMSHQRT